MTLESTNPLPEMEDLHASSAFNVLADFKPTYEAFWKTIKTSRALGRDAEAFWHAVGDVLQNAYDILKKEIDEGAKEKEIATLEEHDAEAALTVTHVLQRILESTPDCDLREKIERALEIFGQKSLIPTDTTPNPEEIITTLL